MSGQKLEIGSYLIFTIQKLFFKAKSIIVLSMLDFLSLRISHFTSLENESIQSTERDVIDFISEGSLIFISNRAINQATHRGVEAIDRL
jgi:hypothetical protein